MEKSFNIRSVKWGAGGGVTSNSRIFVVSWWLLLLKIHSSLRSLCLSSNGEKL